MGTQWSRNILYATNSSIKAMNLSMGKRKALAIYTELLACKIISQAARRELERACCPIHKDIPGLPNDIEVVELQHGGVGDREGTSILDVPCQIQIASRGLYLSYEFERTIDGYVLTVLNEDLQETQPMRRSTEGLSRDGDLDASQG